MMKKFIRHEMITIHRLGCRMVKTIQFSIDKSSTDQSKSSNEGIGDDLEEQIQDITILDENDTVSIMQSDILRLKQDKSMLEWEAESLRIDKVCLEQKNHELQSRIKDLVKKYPSASILLGKLPMDKPSLWHGIKIKLFKK